MRPGENGYDAARHLYNQIYEGTATGLPAAIALCATPSDVQRCVAFARNAKLPFVVRSGGHSYAAYSSGPGLVISVAAMNQVVASANGGAGMASVGAGARLMDVYTQLGTAARLLPGGSCPTVGIAGLALGGGIGVFGRAYGLTCDQIQSVQMVTADGALRRCDPGRHEDLYWACRGGGGGNFGVVTSFVFRTQPLPTEVTLFTLEWPWGAAESIVDAWLRWVPFAPDELWANLQLYASGRVGSGLVKVTGVFVGGVPACESALAPLTAAVGSATSYRFVGPESYLRALMIEGGCEGESIAGCDAPVQSPFAAKSTYVGGALPSEVIGALTSAVAEFPSVLPGGGAGIVFDAYGGAINRIAPGATAFVHRNAVACAQYSVTYPVSAGLSDSAVAAAHGWLSHLESTLAPTALGSYQNYIDPTLPGWQHAYYGANLARLEQIKRRYDPDDAFRFAQSIPVGRPE